MTTIERSVTVTLIDAAKEALSVIRMQDAELGNLHDPDSMARLREAIKGVEQCIAKDERGER